MKLDNSKGTIFYGMHFYPGVAEYRDNGGEPYRVFLNEDTIRSMNPTFAGRPVFVMHVDGVDDKVDDLRKEADGWVIESFFNAADGKHWAKFIVVSERGLKAIRQGMKLSNCYVPRGPFGQGGLWNGVSYAKEIKGGEYEHLAIVPNPRYEESVIMSPEEFKKYNENKSLELKRLANSKREPSTMKFKLFKRAKVENAADFEDMCVILPKSGREVTIDTMVNELDAVEVAKKEPKLFNDGDSLSFKDADGEAVTLAFSEVVALYNAKACNEDDDKDDDKKENEDDKDDDKKENEDDDMDDVENEDDDKDDKKKALKLAEKEEEKELANKKKKNKKKNEADDTAAKKRAEDLRTANIRNAHKEEVIEITTDQVSRGKAKYGS